MRIDVLDKYVQDVACMGYARDYCKGHMDYMAEFQDDNQGKADEDAAHAKLTEMIDVKQKEMLVWVAEAEARRKVRIKLAVGPMQPNCPPTMADYVAQGRGPTQPIAPPTLENYAAHNREDIFYKNKLLNTVNNKLHREQRGDLQDLPSCRLS